MRKLVIKDWQIVFAILVVVFGVIMFYVMCKSDLPAHVHIAQEKLSDGDYWNGNFLMYTLLNLFSGFSGEENLMRGILCVMLAAATTFKYVITKRVFLCFSNSRTATFMALSMLFVFVIPIKPFVFFENATNMYYGYYVPNVWHNSTIIFLFPFAIWLYFLSVRQISEFDNARNYLMILLVVINVFIKPSFFFIFLSAYPLVLLWQYGFTKSFWNGLMPIAVGMICMAHVYLTIYEDATDGSSVVISFSQLFTLDFWKSKLLYLFDSLVLPLFFCIVYRKQCFRDVEFFYIVLLLLAAIGIYWCCTETGPRATHGNFYWQVVPAVWLLFYYMLKICTKQNETKRNETKRNKTKQLPIIFKIIVFLYGAHVVMGVIYLIRFIVCRNYI
ncbi:MAG TPA: hypothetical protein PKW49_10560 [Paludibacteraceae bacterium]|nr:hypothetical protein [Paludibacteraceae bacterium]